MLCSDIVPMEEVGSNMDITETEILGQTGKVILNKETTRMVGDGFTQEAVNKGVAQI